MNETMDEIMYETMEQWMNQLKNGWRQWIDRLMDLYIDIHRYIHCDPLLLVFVIVTTGVTSTGGGDEVECILDNELSTKRDNNYNTIL